MSEIQTQEKSNPEAVHSEQCNEAVSGQGLLIDIPAKPLRKTGLAGFAVLNIIE